MFEECQLAEKLYTHLRHCIETESFDRVLQRFHDLLIDGQAYEAREILAIVDQLTASDSAQQVFPKILNRCCYVLINASQKPKQHREIASKLFALFKAPVSTLPANSSRFQHVKRLRQLVKLFTHTEDYRKLHHDTEEEWRIYRLAQILRSDPEREVIEKEPLINLIGRYYYLHASYLSSASSDSEHQHLVGKRQRQLQQKFESDLLQYVRQRSPSGKNPTLLSQQELLDNIKYFVGEVYGEYSHLDLAYQFSIRLKQPYTFKEFKNELYQYLISSIATDKVPNFKSRLHIYLDNILPESDAKRLDSSLLLRTCNQLLSFLVVTNSQRHEHYVFIDLTANLGNAAVIGLLLRILLLCNHSKPYMEERFAILFQHYESSTQAESYWLINSLENLKIALSAHFAYEGAKMTEQLHLLTEEAA